MGRKKMTTAAAETATATATPSKMEAVRMALAKGIEGNDDIVEFAKTQGVEIPKSTVSIYKSKIKGGKGGGKKKPGRKAAGHEKGNGTLPVGSISDSLVAVKLVRELMAKYSADDIRSIIKMFE